MEKIEEVSQCPFDDVHPDTRAKIDEISRKIKSRSNSRAPSLAGQSRTSSKSKLNESTSSAEDQKNIKSIKIWIENTRILFLTPRLSESDISNDPTSLIHNWQLSRLLQTYMAIFVIFRE